MRFLWPTAALVGTLSAVTFGIPFGTSAAEDPLQAVFARIDRAAQGFKWMTANVQKTAYTAVIDESSTDTGKIFVLKPKPHDLHLRFDFQPPDEKQVMIDSTKAITYYPKTNTTQEYVIGKQTKPMVEQLLLIGFGSTSQDILSGYTVKYGGPETAAGTRTDRIELTPKDKEMLQHFRRVELWISSDTGLAVQQKFYEPGKNYNLAIFTSVDLNTRVTEADVKIRVPKDAKKEVPIGKHHTP